MEGKFCEKVMEMLAESEGVEVRNLKDGWRKVRNIINENNNARTIIAY